MTNEKEFENVKKVLGTPKKYYLANNISFPPNEKFKFNSKKGYLDLFFLGRITRMKNLKFALKILSKTKCPLVFSIYGPIDDLSYWKECKKIVNSLPTNIKVYYRGHIKHKEVKQAITTHDALFLPTLGENFGHSIAECLSEGIPVIISDQTPWNNLNQNRARY